MLAASCRLTVKMALRAAGYRNGSMAHNGEDRLLRKLRIGSGVVLDVGANRGAWAAVLLSHHPEAVVHCFEPGETAFLELSKRLGGRVTLHNVAVSDVAGKVDFHVASDSELSSVYSRGSANGITQVATVTIDETLSDLGIAEVALLKIDTEGHELAVLRGAADSFRKISAIQFEYGGTAVDARIYLRDFFEQLGDHFDLFRLHRLGLVHEPVWHELLEIATYQNWVALRRGARI